MSGKRGSSGGCDEKQGLLDTLDEFFEETDGCRVWRGTFIISFSENGGARRQKSGSRIVEQLGDECALGDTTHVAILIFAGQAFDGAHQDGDVQRFLHEGIHAQLHGFLVLIGPGGDDNNWQQRGNPVKFVESRPAIPVRHVEVEQDQIRRVFNGAGDGLDPILRFVHRETFRLQHGGEAAAHKGVVVGNQYAVVNLLRGVWLRSGSRQRCAGERGFVLKERTPFTGRSVLSGRAAAGGSHAVCAGGS